MPRLAPPLLLALAALLPGCASLGPAACGPFDEASLLVPGLYDTLGERGASDHAPMLREPLPFDDGEARAAWGDPRLAAVRLEGPTALTWAEAWIQGGPFAFVTVDEGLPEADAKAFARRFVEGVAAASDAEHAAWVERWRADRTPTAHEGENVTARGHGLALPGAPRTPELWAQEGGLAAARVEPPFEPGNLYARVGEWVFKLELPRRVLLVDTPEGEVRVRADPAGQAAVSRPRGAAEEDSAASRAAFEAALAGLGHARALQADDVRTAEC